MTTETTAGNTATSVRSVCKETWDSVVAVFANPALRRIQLAFGGSLLGDGAYFVALTVWAYDVGGAKVVGVWIAVRYVLMALVAPVGSTVADRVSRKAVMVGADLLRCVIVVAAAVCLYVGTSPWPVFVLGTLGALVGSVFRPAQMAWMPSLVTTPQELTASNGTSSTLESLAFFVGPALGAGLLAATDVPTVFLVEAATFLWSAGLVWGIRPRPAPPGAVPSEPATQDPPQPADEGEPTSMLAEAVAGFKSIATDRDLLMVAALISVQTIASGALMVFGVVVAVEILGTGPQGVGYLEAILGVGAIVGGFFAIGRAARPRLASDLWWGVLLWASPLVLVAVAPQAAPVVIAMALIGFANAVVDVSYATILQRVTPDAVLGRVFGAVEGLLIGTMAFGSLVTPYLIQWCGLRWALAIIGFVVAAGAVPWLARVRRLDRTLGQPEGTPLLRAIPFFQPLAPSTVDGLARQLGLREAVAGEVVLRQGESSDRFFVIESGRVRVTQDGRTLREEGPGEYFGEIGLLRDVPRTATVTALEPTVLRTLDRDDFLAAVTGSEDASARLDEVVSRRLAV